MGNCFGSDVPEVGAVKAMAHAHHAHPQGTVHRLSQIRHARVFSLLILIPSYPHRFLLDHAIYPCSGNGEARHGPAQRCSLRGGEPGDDARQVTPAERDRHDHRRRRRQQAPGGDRGQERG